MTITVEVLSGRHHGPTGICRPGDTVEVSEEVYRAFRDKFRALDTPEQPSSNQPIANDPVPEPVVVEASKAAERLADEHGIDLAGIEGSGPGGKVYKADVEAVIGDA